MPLIPAESLPTVAPAGATGVFQRVDAQPSAFGGLSAAALGRVGAAEGQMGDVLAEHAVRFQQQQNVANVNDTYANSFGPAFRDQYQKYYALQGKDAVDQMPDYINTMQELRAKVRDQLPNEQQKKLFDEMSRRRVESELDGMARYADTQNKVWRRTSHLSMLDQLSQQAADKHNDEQAFGTALGSAQAEIDRYVGSTGGSAEQARAEFSKFASGAITNRIQSAMLNDPIAARDLYRANVGMIEPQQRPVLEHQLRTAVLPVEAKRAAEQVIRGSPLPNLETALTIAGEPLISAVVARESGGNAGAVSPKGAVGLMQLMPDTAREVAGEMGLEFDQEKLGKDAGYNKALGSRYLSNMLARYGGNQTLALAAYNAGPGNVDKWVKAHGDPNKGEISEADFAAKIPFKETREYVANINAKAPATAQAPTSSRDTRAQLTNWIPQAEKMADALHPNDPVFRDMVLSNVKGYVNTIVSAQEGAQRQAHGMLIKAADGAAGGPKPLSLDELRSTPELKQAWEITDAASQRGIIALVEHNARAAQGVPIRVDGNVVEGLLRRIGLPNDDPNKIRNEAQLTPYFHHGVDKSHFEWLQKRIDDLRTPEGQRLSSVRNDFFSAVKAQFDKSTMVKLDEKGGEDFLKFKQYVTAQETAARNAGKDPYEIYNTGSPDYVGKKIPIFQRTMEQQLKDMAESLKRNQPAALPPEQQRKAGETPDQYLARMGAK
jgi:hypothetical protein